MNYFQKLREIDRCLEIQERTRLQPKMKTTATTSPDTDATANPTQIFKRGVVVEVIYDLAAYPEEDWEEMKALVKSSGSSKHCAKK